MSDRRAHRWYDRDPMLGRALESLRQAPSRYHAQVSLNLIKILVEHHIEGESDGTVMSDAIAEALERARTLEDHTRRRRWYDVNEMLRSAMLLLEDMPDDLQDRLIPHVAESIESTLACC